MTYIHWYFDKTSQNFTHDTDFKLNHSINSKTKIYIYLFIKIATKNSFIIRFWNAVQN